MLVLSSNPSSVTFHAKLFARGAMDYQVVVWVIACGARVPEFYPSSFQVRV